MIDDDFKVELRGEMRTNRAALYDVRQVNRSLVVAVNENVGVTREVRDEVRAMRGDLQDLRGELHDMGGELHDMRGELHDMRGELHDMRGELHDMRGEMRGLLTDIRDVLKANTEALFLILDELRGGGGPASAPG